MTRWLAWIKNRPWLALPAFVCLVVAVRFKYLRQGVLDGLPYFLEADCYTRMMRVKCLLEDGKVFRAFHPWENAPEGITTHATSLLDLLIALPALILSPLSPHALDWCGWLVPPLSAGVAGVMLMKWSAEPSLALGWTRWPLLLTFALHPLTLWSNSAGRPDHQALVVPLLSLAFVLDLLRVRNGRWVWASGLCWGTALWVSLYEPLALFLISLGLTILFQRRQVLRWLAIVAMVAVPAWLCEGWRWQESGALWQNPLTHHWLAMIGELHSPLPWYWLSFALAPVALLASLPRWRHHWRETLRSSDFSTWYPLVIALALVGLSLWQQRWMALLPFPLAWCCLGMLRSVTSPAWRTCLATLHLLPMVLWSLLEMSQLQPPHEWARTRAVAENIRGEGAILAPWWLSPALLYYSGNPIVASSSHQSLPGIIDSARFFTTADFVEADQILLRHGVEWIAVYQPIRSFVNARQILYGPSADPTIDQRDFYRYVVLRLWEFKMVPTRYQFVFATEEWKLYRYTPPATAGEAH